MSSTRWLSKIRTVEQGAERKWRTICDRSVDADTQVEELVREIISTVRQKGDAAVASYTQRFDNRSPRKESQSYEIPAEEWKRAYEALAKETRDALERSAERIRQFHAPQKKTGYTLGQGLSLRVSALHRVGIYVPGGTALYPSSVLMTAIPAQIAGVGEIIMVTPGASAETLAAAYVAGVDRVFEIGGAQAVAALAYGTQTIPRVDKIVGPGNQWVASAKRQVFGQVDIDSIAGPSEVLVIADQSASPRLVAIDLLAQAEHDTEARAILIATDESIIDAVDDEIDKILPQLGRKNIAESSLRDYGVGLCVESVEEGVEWANLYASEHLELALEEAEKWVDSVRTAGAIFVGHYTPEAAGDYSAGPNHVLPTSGAARYASPLGVYDFQKFTSVLSLSKSDLGEIRHVIGTLAKTEGLDAHGMSVAMRFEEK